MPVIQEPERSKIYTRVKHLLGAPIRSVELEDEMMDSLMELSIQDYEQYILNWLIDSQWVNLVNLNMKNESVANALITRTMDFEQQFQYSYSKIVGLQNTGPWVLKKDYFTLSANTQTYEIPAGREINELLWLLPFACGKYFDFITCMYCCNFFNFPTIFRNRHCDCRIFSGYGTTNDYGVGITN